ncbi:SurA N-terminal domain-containing protein [Geoalkalibacter halelectricus]|uniref:SurA N-terminal domain-containing protein n=1 Tax=Geoalkalibacter halelectricus TaxID=2847045 RepID=A0ABY5ZQK5_9BACT|nr:SurA N-terminal domain-containing protein [Geoalkalibacter halelectricus]MDO3378453.1 SurA N-terminal domain-containing protein [Geoalkalibacter halelectricus]UWZ80227.1 SurA N-terminal domain-containing protein [Geoalkalibacter halelectricus]
MKHALFLLLAVLLFGAAPAAAEQVLSKIAAVVNDDIITTYQLEKELTARLATEARGRNLPTEEVRRLRNEVLDVLIDEALVMQRVRHLGMSVSDEEVEEAITDVLRQNQITREQLSQALSAQGLSMEDYRERLRRQILRFQLIGHEVQSRVEVTTQDIRDYFRANIDNYRGNPTLTISYIAFTIPTDAQVSNVEVESIRTRAREAMRLLRQGEDMDSTLFIFADDPGVQGGELGTFTEAELSDAFARAVAGLESGAITELIESPEGFYILKVEERNPGPIRQFDAVKEEIRQHLLEENREERFREWSAGLKKDAFIDIRI